MARRLPKAWLFCAWSALLLPLSCARAMEPGLRLSASHTIQHESNLFRLPDGSDPVSILGRPSTGERVDITSLRVQYSKQLSLQQLDVDIGLVDYDYDIYNTLDLFAHNYNLEWRWSLTPRWRGRARAERASSVGSFDDASLIESGNQRLRRHEVVDASYELDGVWRLLMAAQRTRSTFEQPQVGEDGTSVRSAEVGIRFDVPSGSIASMRWRQGSGQNLVSDRLPLPLADASFDQSEWLFDLRWKATAKTLATMSAGRTKRDYATASDRDYSGTNASLAVDWSASAKSLLSVRLTSDISGYVTEGSSYARTRRLELAYVWSIGPRTQLRLGLNQSRLSLGGPPAGVAPNPLRYTSRDATLSLQWDPHRSISLESSLVDTRRRSNTSSQRFSNLKVRGSAILSF